MSRRTQFTNVAAGDLNALSVDALRTGGRFSPCGGSCDLGHVDQNVLLRVELPHDRALLFSSEYQLSRRLTGVCADSIGVSRSQGRSR